MEVVKREMVILLFLDEMQLQFEDSAIEGVWRIKTMYWGCLNSELIKPMKSGNAADAKAKTRSNEAFQKV